MRNQELSMNLHQQLFGRSRAHALQRGLVLDISPAARLAFIEVPMAITPRLWRSIAPDDPFRLKDRASFASAGPSC